MSCFAMSGDRRPNSLVFHFFLGTASVGAVVGLRGSIAMPYVKANYDVAAGWPLKKPDFLKTGEPTVTASIQFTF